MNIITHINNCIFLWRENRTEVLKSKKANINIILKVTKNTYKRKNSWVRNQVTILIRKIRKENPYKVQDFSKAKELYDNITPIDLSIIKPNDYVVKFSREEPVKGKRWCEYYVNQSGNIGTYKIEKWNEKYKYWSVEDYTGDTNTYGNSLDEDSSRSYRFATKEEIQEFKNKRKEYKQKRKEIEVLQKQLSELYKQL